MHRSYMGVCVYYICIYIMYIIYYTLYYICISVYTTHSTIYNILFYICMYTHIHTFISCSEDGLYSTHDFGCCVFAFDSRL